MPYRNLMNTKRPSIIPKHAINQVAERTPEVFTAGKAVLIDKEDVVLKARVEVGLKTELSNDRVMMAVDMGVNSVHPLEHLSDHAWE